MLMLLSLAETRWLAVVVQRTVPELGTGLQTRALDCQPPVIVSMMERTGYQHSDPVPTSANESRMTQESR